MDSGAELLFFVGPEMSHLIAEVELGRRLIAFDPRLSIAILIPKHPIPNENLDASIRSLAAGLRLDPTAGNIELVELSPLDNLPPNWAFGGHILIVDLITRLYKPIVKQFIEDRRDRRRPAGIVYDIFCAPMVDLAEELGLPSYLFYSSGVNMLSMTLEMESLGEPNLPARFAGASPESTPVNVPGFRNPVPKKVWPALFSYDVLASCFVRFASQYRKSKGILVNTFSELESDIVHALSEKQRNVPPLYPVGPILPTSNSESESINERAQDPTLSWLDDQSTGSVVFLCFGSGVASFEKAQVKELAAGLERSGYRFLWSLRAPSLEEFLPEGFLERTAVVGKVIGWAPQKEVLAHKAVGAFVSHCGWNSVMESLWFAVPLVAWPMYAEQQLNAFMLVVDLGLAVNLRMDYHHDLREHKGNMVVVAADVEAALRRAVEGEEGAAVRKKVREVSDVARGVVEVGGSSYVSLSRFVDDVFKNLE